MKKIFLLFIISFYGCKAENAAEKKEVPKSTKISATVEANIPSPENSTGATIRTRFNPPEGYERTPMPVTSFGYYLRSFPLHPAGHAVRLYNEELKPNQSAHAAVLDIDVGKRDLQQCADAVMRLRAEYFFDAERYENISFNFVNGFPAKYSKWRAGEKISVKGNNVKWVPSGEKQDTPASFRKYMDIVFSYASTLSLEKEMRKKDLEDIQIGDVFIQGGSPGHAVIVVDAAVNEQTNDIVFLLAQSYMPAQEIHILKNYSDAISPWYSVNSIKNEIKTPEWTFYRDNLKSFE